MLYRRFLLAAIAAIAMFGTSGAEANSACASWSVTGPVVGTVGTGPHCAPTPFTHSITWNQCGGTPPIGEAHCVNLVLQTPL